MRLVWLTDIHLDFASSEAVEGLEREVNDAHPDAILLGGDIGEAYSLRRMLEHLAGVFSAPTYVVLGNHDFYYGSIVAVRSAITDLAASNPHLVYLSAEAQPIQLSDEVALAGHDGWADAREGDYNSSLVMMNDYMLIEELSQFSKQDRLSELHRLGDEAARVVRGQLHEALSRFRKVFVLTHVPPFLGACWYQGRISDRQWAPHFVCQAMGRAILDAADVHPDRQITVLCGHTHSPGEYRPADNVHVITGGAEYGHPRITKTFELI